MNRLTKIFSVAFLLVAFAVSAHAQQQPSAAALASAREIVDLKGSSALFDPVIVGVIERNKLTFLQMNPNLQQDLNAVSASLRTEYAPRQAEIKDNMARLYAKHFSEAELKDILAFYKSPLGRKMSQEEPKFVDESMQFMDGWAEKLASEVNDRFRAEMKKKGHTL